MIDTHCHFTFDDYADNLDQVLARSVEAGVTAWITIGTNLADSRTSVELAGRYDNMYAAVGVHPHDAKDVNASTLTALGALARKPAVVAIGETGLDFHYNYSPAQTQQEVFSQHMRLADQLNLPLIVHSREAFEPTLELLTRGPLEPARVVFHCFSGNADQGRQLAAAGYYASFTGVVTFKNAADIREAAKTIPPDRIMLETDCPFMSPAPKRNHRPNEPALMPHTARKLAEIRNEDYQSFCNQTTQNAHDFFGIAI